MPTKSFAPTGVKLLLASVLLAGLVGVNGATAQDRLPWLRDNPDTARRYEPSSDVDRDALPPPDPSPYGSAPRAGEAYESPREDTYRPPAPTYGGAPRAGDSYGRPREEDYRPPAQSYGSAPRGSDTYGGRRDDAYRPSPQYESGSGRRQARDDAYRPPTRYEPSRESAYAPPYPPRRDEPQWREDNRSNGYGRDRYAASGPPYDDREPPPRDGTYSMREIIGEGHGFFGSISEGLASVIEYAFKTQGRPNGYILGEDLGGAFVAGLRYGEGRLYTRDAGTHRVYWQGPSIGYDAGAEGSKVMVLVYNMRDPSEIFQRFGGVAGSAYVVGGVGLTFQKRDDIVLAPIRAGVGFRLGANVGYLKYTPRPTWNPF
jgi:hypothetical protein